jgi:hypothetical protein
MIGQTGRGCDQYNCRDEVDFCRADEHPQSNPIFLVFLVRDKQCKRSHGYLSLYLFDYSRERESALMEDNGEDNNALRHDIIACKAHGVPVICTFMRVSI